MAALMLWVSFWDAAERLFEAVHARLHLVERIVEGLDLAGNRVYLRALGVLSGGKLFLQRVHVDGHAVDGVGGLLDEVLEDAHALIVRLLGGARTASCSCWIWVWELHHVLVDGEGWGGREDEREGKEAELGHGDLRAARGELRACLPPLRG